MNMRRLSAACAMFRGQKAALGDLPFWARQVLRRVARAPHGLQYIVYGQPCAQGENRTQTSPQDVLRPGRVFLQADLRHTLPWNRERYPLLEQESTAEAQAFFRSCATIFRPCRGQGILRRRT